MLPTKSFKVCVRPAPSDTRMSAENSTFCADVDTADITNNDMVASPRAKAFISAPCSLRSSALGSARANTSATTFLLSTFSCGQTQGPGWKVCRLHRKTLWTIAEDASCSQYEREKASSAGLAVR